MKTKVDKDLCIGCGACVGICPEVFNFNDEGLAEAITEEINKDDIEKVRDAVESCPTDAISEVTDK